MLLSQGGSAFQAGWEALLSAWQILESLLVARGALALGEEVRERLLQQLRKRRVVEQHSAQRIERGGSARNVKRTLERRPWSPEELRMIMDVPSVRDAEDLLALFGQSPNSAGEYVVSESEEARLLRLAEHDVFNTVIAATSDAELRGRLERLLQTGKPQ
jgi:hypothetical protein